VLRQSTGEPLRGFFIIKYKQEKPYLETSNRGFGMEM